MPHSSSASSLEYSYGIIPLRQTKEGQWETLIVQQHQGFWGFPKGHALEGETDKQAAERELQEETGLRITQWLSEIPLTQEYENPSRHTHKVVYYFLAKVDGTLKPQEGEILSARWVPLASASESLTYNDTKDLCHQVQMFLINHVNRG